MLLWNSAFLCNRYVAICDRYHSSVFSYHTVVYCITHGVVLYETSAQSDSASSIPFSTKFIVTDTHNFRIRYAANTLYIACLTLKLLIM